MSFSVMLSIAALAVTMLVHLAGFIWWAATLTSRVGHIEQWIRSNTHLHEQMIALGVKVDALTGGISDMKLSMRVIFDKIDGKADK